MAISRTLSIPRMIYGTAWKKDRTESLVLEALRAGFRGIDTAAQPKHYQEHLVGAGVRAFLASSSSTQRSDLYIQTKFTSVAGQDPGNIPYDPSASLEDQVHASIAGSLRNFRHDSDSNEAPYLDCLVLHSPLPTMEQTMRVWRVLESYVPHSVRRLGISNIYSLTALERLFAAAEVKPAVVQNRFCREVDYAREIYRFCVQRGVVFQSFWTLTANPELLRSQPVAHVAREVGISPQAALYNLLLRSGNWSVLNGTTNSETMQHDLESLEAMDVWAAKNIEMELQLRRDFQRILG